VIMGSGFTIDAEGVERNPVPYSNLVATMKKTDLHALAMVKIVSKVGGLDEAGRVKWYALQSMGRLRVWLLRSWAREVAKDEAIAAAKHLRFRGEASWNINSNTLVRAIELIRNTELSLEDLPIHHSMIFEEDRKKVVWSCFGYMAPSFRVPGGRAFSLEKEMMAVARGPKGGKLPAVPVAKIACRNVVLPIAFRDLEEMIEKKEILNPHGQPNQRTSQMNLDKFFSGEECRSIVGSLRSLCGVTSADLSKGKRKAGELDYGDEERKKKMPAGFSLFD